ncbi:MAG: hypothetical protein MSH47_04850 [Bacteroidales bacterium]|nr:hypothetical protein [Bacteroidales bacterium]
MKKKIILIVGVLALIAVIAVVIIDQCKVVSEYRVSLHRNYFETEGYNSKEAVISLPFEVMLLDFVTDTTYTDDCYFKATILVQPLNNNNPDSIETVVLEPYQVEEYKKHRIYISEYFYNKTENQLRVLMQIEQRKYQTY